MPFTFYKWYVTRYRSLTARRSNQEGMRALNPTVCHCLLPISLLVCFIEAKVVELVVWDLLIGLKVIIADASLLLGYFGASFGADVLSLVLAAVHAREVPSDRVLFLFRCLLFLLLEVLGRLVLECLPDSPLQGFQSAEEAVNDKFASLRLVEELFVFLHQVLGWHSLAGVLLQAAFDEVVELRRPLLVLGEMRWWRVDDHEQHAHRRQL